MIIGYCLNTSDWIQLATAIGTVLLAIAAFWTLWQSRNYNRIRNSLLPVKEGPLHLKGYCHTNTVAHWTNFQFTTIQFHIEPFQGGLLVGGTGLPTTFFKRV